MGARRNHTRPTCGAPGFALVGSAVGLKLLSADAASPLTPGPPTC